MWQKFDNSINCDNNRDNREEARNFLCSYVLMSYFKPRIARMWQKFDNSINRDDNRDNREVFMFLCSYVFFNRE